MNYSQPLRLDFRQIGQYIQLLLPCLQVEVIIIRSQQELPKQLAQSRNQRLFWLRGVTAGVQTVRHCRLVVWSGALGASA